MRDDGNWRHDYLKNQGGLSTYQQKILLEGPKSLPQAWQLNAMWYDYKKRFNNEPST
jgi:hypothetical protein